MPDPDLIPAIEDAASSFKRATGDTGSKENYDLKDLIEADKYLKSKTNINKGFTLRKILPGGSA